MMADNFYGKKVMVFGVFDRLHPGHDSFLQQATHYAKELVVVVARDDVVFQLKKKKPLHTQEVRLKVLKENPLVTLVVLGDVVLGSYDVVRAHNPDIICLGYDQHALKDDLKKCMARGALKEITLVILDPHEPDRFHSSLLTPDK